MTLEQALLYHSTGLEEAEEGPAPHRSRVPVFLLVAVAASIGIIGLKRHLAHGLDARAD
ncbi:MAG TPA: hypothetical protein VJB57_19030 [Dehalococcoidia bacterium]|nr:hypothetical protein [Dehalococcoidia bacterium]